MRENGLAKLLPIDLPPTIDEQIAIATALSDRDAELANLEAQLAKTRALKQGMMQKLLTGGIRLL
jgi:type I restriction enzyme S subunit